MFKILKVFREVKGITTPDEKSLGVICRKKVRSIVFVIIKSGITLFAIQLAPTGSGCDHYESVGDGCSY